jgi:hypothetical protein
MVGLDRLRMMGIRLFIVVSKESNQMELSTEQIEQIAKATAEEVKRHHSCRFNEDEAKVLHDMSRASDVAGADESTYIFILKFGRDFQDALRKISRWMILVVIILILVLAGKAIDAGKFIQSFKFW